MSPVICAHHTGAAGAGMGPGLRMGATIFHGHFTITPEPTLGEAMMKAFCAGFAGCLLLLAAGSAHALSVDCNKITNPDENTICSEVSLAKMDKDLDNAYALSQAHLPLKMR